MRGVDVPQDGLFTYTTLEAIVPPTHPLRPTPPTQLTMLLDGLDWTRASPKPVRQPALVG